MKIIIILLGLMTLLSSGISLPQLLSPARNTSVGNKEPSDDIEDIAEHTLALIAKGQTEIPLEEDHKDVILIVGNAGAGKTTLAKFLSGEDLESYEAEGRFLIRDAEGKIRTTNQTTSAPKTIFPDLFVEPTTNISYYDLPGFSDSRNASIEIANGIFMKIVADHVEKIKLVFVAPFFAGQKQENHDNFRTLFDHATDFIRNPEKFKTAIALVLTKVDPSVEDEVVVGEIVSFLNSEKKSLNISFEDETKREQVEQIIDAFLTQDSNGSYHRIGLFKQPSKPGQLNQIEYFQKLLPKLQAIITENIKYVRDDPQDFGLTISKKVHKYINAIAEKVRENFKNGMGRLATSIGNHYELLINTHPLEAVVGTVVKDTTVLDSMSQSLINSTTRQEFIDILIQGLVQVSVPSNDFLAGILFQQSNLEFIEIIEGNQTTPLIQEWSSPLNETVVFLKDEMNKMLEMLSSRMDQEVQMAVATLQEMYNIERMDESENYLTADLLILEGMIFQMREKTSFNELLHLISNSINDLYVNASFSTDTLELEEDIEIPSYPQLKKQTWIENFYPLVQKLKTEFTTEDTLMDFETTMAVDAVLDDNNELQHTEAEKNELRELRDQIGNLTGQISAMAEEIKTTEHQKKELEQRINEINKSLQELHKKKGNLRQMLAALKHQLVGASGSAPHDVIVDPDDLPIITTDHGVCASACKNFTYSYDWCYLKKLRYNDYYWDYCTPPEDVVRSNINFSAHGLPCKSECKLEEDVYKCTTERFGIGSKFEKSDYCSPRVGYDYRDRKCKGNCFESSMTKVCWLETGKRSMCSF